MDTNYLKYGKKYPSILQRDKVFQDSWIPVTTINAKEHHNPQDAFGQAHNLAVVDFFQINSASTKGEFINRAFEFFNVPRQFRNWATNLSRKDLYFLECG